MPIPARLAARPARYLLLAALLGCLAGTPLHARQDGKSRSEQAAAKHKLAELQQKMDALAKQQADTASRRDRANADQTKAQFLGHEASPPCERSRPLGDS